MNPTREKYQEFDDMDPGKDSKVGRKMARV